MPNSQKMSDTDRGFLQGIICALASVRTFGNTVIFDQIVRDGGRGPLIAEARKSGQMRNSGLSEYLRRNP